MKRIQDKITELSKKPSTNADTIAVLRMCQARIEQLEQENGEKAAQVELLRKAIIDATNNGTVTDTGRWIYSIDASVLDKAPAQCLAEVRAQAFSAGFEYAFKRTSEGFNGECANDHLSYKWEFHRQDLDDLPDAGKEMLDAGINEFIQDQK